MYNRRTMPNAQTHLAAVCDLLAEPSLQVRFPWLAADRVQAAFLLGAISPDVRAISGHPREVTHFFEIPPGGEPAQVRLFAEWPALADAAALGRTHAAFVAGYVSHLVMDEAWVEQVVMPGLFIQGMAWGVEHPNWRLYSLLMTYLEYRAADRLPGRAVDLLAGAEPAGWLPFVSDDDLVAWRDHVISRIAGGARLISRMFATSNGLSPGELEAIVLSERRMAGEVFSRVPRAYLDAFWRETNGRTRRAVVAYLEKLREDA
jgi:hypothetical protein